MFKKEMAGKLDRIFGLKKTTFNTPSEEFEQDTLFIFVESANTKIISNRELAKVEGFLVVFTQRDKTPYGFFSKRIEKALAEDKQDFFFSEIDSENVGSPARQINLSERRCRFLYFYSAQYDPNKGQLTSIEIE